MLVIGQLLLIGCQHIMKENNKKEILNNVQVKKFLKKWKPNVVPSDIHNMEQELVKLIKHFQNDKEDPKYLGIPNIQFSLTSSNDKREKEFRKQRIQRGFDNSETWSLKDTIANFILPRLKAYRENIDGFIVDTFGLYEKVDLSIRAFELVIKDGNGKTLSKEEWEEYDKGMIAFGEVYIRLWW